MCYSYTVILYYDNKYIKIKLFVSIQLTDLCPNLCQAQRCPVYVPGLARHGLAWTQPDRRPQCLVFYICCSSNIVFYNHIVQKELLVYTQNGHNDEWTLLKACCFFLISLRSMINLAHAFKSPFLDVEITIKVLFFQYTLTTDFLFYKNASLLLEYGLNASYILQSFSSTFFIYFLLFCKPSPS